MRTIRRPKIIGAVFAAALLFGFAAQAQATDVVYVSNIGQNKDGSDNANFSGITAFAQRFTTGGKAGGYELKRIEVNMTIGGGGTVQLMMHSSGSPGDMLCKLTLIGGNANDTFDARIVRFETDTSDPECADATKTHLEPNTHYWVAMFETGQSPPIWETTASANEDSGAIAGWGIADTYKYQDNPGDAWRTQGGSSAALQIRVVGTNTPPTASDGRVQTDEETAYTFQTRDFGDLFRDDDDDSLHSVKITGLPGGGKGTLSLANTDISTTPRTVTAGVDL